MLQVFIVVWFGREGNTEVGSVHETKLDAEKFALGRRNANDCDNEDHNTNNYVVIERKILK